MFVTLGGAACVQLSFFVCYLLPTAKNNASPFFSGLSILFFFCFYAYCLFYFLFVYVYIDIDISFSLPGMGEKGIRPLLVASSFSGFPVAFDASTSLN